MISEVLHIPLLLQSTFTYYVVGTNCSREFTHRVKSVSMAKFTSQEVSALQGGGNAVHIQLLSFPDDIHVSFTCLSILQHVTHV